MFVFAILYYGTLAQTDIVYGSVFTIYIVFSIAMLIMLFYVPMLTITYDLRLRDIYKNSLLLIFGKILRNIVALVLVVIVSFAVFLAVIYTKGAMLVVAVALSVIFYPMIATYIIVSVIAKVCRSLSATSQVIMCSMSLRKKKFSVKPKQSKTQTPMMITSSSTAE